MKLFNRVNIHTKLLLLLGVVAITFSACEKDNYEPPNATLSGKLVYKGEPLQLEYNQVPYQIFQYGFGKVGPIDQVFTPEGTFSQLLFPGDYKFTVANSTVPFIWNRNAAGKPDSLAINLTGSKTMDIEVTPYYLVRNAQISKSGSSVSATFNVEKIVTDANAKTINKVVLFVNKTQFVSNNDNIAQTAIDGKNLTNLTGITAKVDIPTIVPTQTSVYARVGLQIGGINSWIFSPVQKLDL